MSLAQLFRRLLAGAKGDSVMRRPVELWSTLGGPNTKTWKSVVDRAVLLERDGWSGATLTDSQCLRGDVFVTLTACALATKTLKLGTGTSNPATRHPSILASATATLQILSEGRMSLSLGRGDSALAYIGAPPVPVAYFERSLAMIQAYLKGEDIALADAADLLPAVPKGFDQLALAAAPEASRLTWLPADFPRPEIEVAATGPKVIAVAARHADCIAFTVGANIERLRWAISVAREEIEKAGRDPATVRFGAYVPLYPHPDIDIARGLVKGMVASHGRFSIMNKKVVGPVTDAQRKVLEKVASSYDMSRHGRAEGKQSDAVDPEFIEDYAIIGDPSRCADRLQEIIELGLERMNLWTGADEGASKESYRLAAEKVLPRVMEAVN